MYRIRCKSCQNLLTIPDDQVGEPFRCPSCQNLIVIRPKATAAAGAVNTAAAEPPTSFVPQDDEDEAIVLGEKDAPTLPSVSLPRRAKRVEAIFVNCRVCNQRMQISTSDLGKAIQCESCKAVMKVDLPTVEASLAAAAVTPVDDEDNPLAPADFDPPDIQDIPSTHRSYARRRANLRGRLGEKLAIGIFALALLGALAWVVHHYMLQGKPLRNAPQANPPAATEKSTAATPAAKTTVDTYSWIDTANPNLWDTFLDAAWGANPSSLKNLTPTEPPTELFDGGNLKWYQAAPPPEQIGSAKIRAILYAFLQQGGELRLCEIQVQCQTSNDCELFKEYLSEKLGPGESGKSPFATHEWQGQTSAQRDVLIEVGGKTPSFDGTMIRAAIQGVQ